MAALVDDPGVCLLTDPLAQTPALVADDNALMARVALRDAAAFRALVEAHNGALYRLAFRMLGDAAAAEDVAQDALLKLWAQAARWTGVGPGVGAWLRRVATNQCLDRLRRNRFNAGNEIPERADESPLADERLDAMQQVQTIKSALGALSDRQRAAIVLTYYESQPNAGAAAALGLNIKAFESLLLRARTALRRELETRGLPAGGEA
jgi:RNA polymerase sigma-70 factor (ECF subfamily)